MTDRQEGEKRHRAGRRPSPVWTFFTVIRTSDKKVHARCNFCAKRCAGVAARMRSHVLNKCENSPTDIERLLDEAIANSAAVRTAVRTAVPNTAVTATGTSSTSVVEPDSAIIPGVDAIQPSALPIDTDSSPPPKRLKQTQVQHVQAPVEMENNPVSTQEVDMNSDFEEPEADIAKDDDGTMARVSDQQVTQNKFSEEDAARVHQKLVLACVLNDVPAAFVEDEALVEAFNLARPGLPRLSAEQAKTSVLQYLADEASKEMEQSLASCKVFTVVHRHFKKQGSRDSGLLTTWCNQWIGVNEHRNVFPLKEVYQEVQTSSPSKSCCGYCVPREQFDAVVAKYCRAVAPEAVFNLCCECPRLYQQLRLEQQPVLSTSLQDADSMSGIAVWMKTQVLLSTCLLHQSLILRKELLSTFPTVFDLISKAILLAHSISKIAPFRQKLETLLELSSWDAVPRIVRCMVHLEGGIRRYQEKMSVPAEEIASFWDNLRLVSKLLSPFNWMLALSNAKETTSAQFIVLWLWLLAVVKSTNSSLLPEEDKESFASTVISLIGHQVDSHELVCMLLDPRISGVGLSITGKRRVKSLVVKVAERVFSSGGFESGGARSQLLSQLGDYTDRSGVFDDVVAWEMSAGRPPRLFWNDFVEDAPHLTRVAHAVISVSPCARTASESLDPLTRTQESAWEQTFAVRQVKYQAKITPPLTTGNVDDYRSLLFPCAPLEQGISDEILSVEVNKALQVSSTNTPRWAASDEAEVEARVMNQLRSMLKVGRDEEVGQTRATPTERSGPLSSGASWFAFQSANDLTALEQAVRNFLPCPPTVKII